MFTTLLSTFRRLARVARLRQLSVKIELDRSRHLLPGFPFFQVITGDWLPRAHTCFVWLGPLHIALELPATKLPAGTTTTAELGAD